MSQEVYKEIWPASCRDLLIGDVIIKQNVPGPVFEAEDIELIITEKTDKFFIENEVSMLISFNPVYRRYVPEPD